MTAGRLQKLAAVLVAPTATAGEKVAAARAMARAYQEHPELAAERLDVPGAPPPRPPKRRSSNAQEVQAVAHGIVRVACWACGGSPEASAELHRLIGQAFATIAQLRKSPRPRG